MRVACEELLHSLGEYVRQTMHSNPEWRTGIKAVEEAVYTAKYVVTHMPVEDLTAMAHGLGLHSWKDEEELRRMVLAWPHTQKVAFEATDA